MRTCDDGLILIQTLGTPSPTHTSSGAKIEVMVNSFVSMNFAEVILK